MKGSKLLSLGLVVLLAGAAGTKSGEWERPERHPLAGCVGPEVKVPAGVLSLHLSVVGSDWSRASKARIALDLENRGSSVVTIGATSLLLLARDPRQPLFQSVFSAGPIDLSSGKQRGRWEAVDGVALLAGARRTFLLPGPDDLDWTGLYWSEVASVDLWAYSYRGRDGQDVRLAGRYDLVVTTRIDLAGGGDVCARSPGVEVVLQ